MTPLLWVNDPEGFAESLLATGVEKFIIQPFHFEKGKFTASTREEAIDLMAQKLDCDRVSFRERYEAHYRSAHRILKSKLPHLGEGKLGFSPPF